MRRRGDWGPVIFLVVTLGLLALWCITDYIWPPAPRSPGAPARPSGKK